MRSHGKCLPLAQIVERLVESPLQLTGSVRRGAAVPHEDQHGSPVNHIRRITTCGQWSAAAPNSSWPVRQAWRRLIGSAKPADRTIHTTIAKPASSSGTFHQPRAAIGNGASSKPPLNGHQNVDVFVHAPV